MAGVFAAALGLAWGLQPHPVGAEVASDEAVATFNGGRIALADVQSVIDHRLPAEQARIARPGGVAGVVESLVRYDLLVLEAQARGYNDKPNVQDAVRRKASELYVQQAVAVDPQSFSADEVAKGREARQRDFGRPAMRRASHIVVATQKEAAALIAELKHAGREQFAREATARSLDATTARQGGELGYFTRDSQTDRGHAVAIAPQLAAAAFALPEAGALSPQPIQVPNGWSVLMLTGIMPAFAQAPAEVEERVRAQLAEQVRKEKLDALMQQLRTDYKLVVHPELVDALVFSSEVENLGIPEGFPAAPPDPREPPKLVEPDDY